MLNIGPFVIFLSSEKSGKREEWPQQNTKDLKEWESWEPGPVGNLYIARRSRLGRVSGRLSLVLYIVFARSSREE